MCVFRGMVGWLQRVKKWVDCWAPYTQTTLPLRSQCTNLDLLNFHHVSGGKLQLQCHLKKGKRSDGTYLLYLHQPVRGKEKAR